jgi:hypothetical protein
MEYDADFTLFDFFLDKMNTPATLRKLRGIFNSNCNPAFSRSVFDLDAPNFTTPGLLFGRRIHPFSGNYSS